MEFSKLYREHLKAWESSYSLRELKTPQGIDFCSNDYLSLSESQDLKELILKNYERYNIGTTGSRLLRGHDLLTEQLEKELSEFSGKETSLFFSSGYQANLGLISSFRGQNVCFYSDELNHASIIDGITLSKADKKIFLHNDTESLKKLLQENSEKYDLNIIYVESIYSMRGSLAPLKEIARLCQEWKAYLIVDEAHATGLYGDRGSGRVEALGLSDTVFATVHTAGKVLGGSGAWVSCSQELRQWLIQKARSFVYSTSPMPFQQVAVLEAVKWLKEYGDYLRDSYFKKLKSFQKEILIIAANHGLKVFGVGGPVTSLVVKENQKAVVLMENLQEKGFDVRAIRPPTVPEGEALLRLTLPLNRSQDEINDLLQAIREEVEA